VNFFMVVLAILVGVVLANLALQFIARWVNPLIGQLMEIDGERLHYIERGNRAASTLVMLHGNGTLIQDLTISGLVDAAAKDYRVICFDRPGFGYSKKRNRTLQTREYQSDLLLKAMRALGVDEPIIVAHSWATLIALSMAGNRSHKIRGVILISGYYFPTWRFDTLIAGSAALPLLGHFLRYTISPLMTFLAMPALAKAAFSLNAIPEIVKAEYPKLILIRPSQLRSAAEEANLMVSAAARLEPQYPNIDCPVMIFAGEQDAVVESFQAKRLANILPRAKLTLIPRSGHMLHYFAANAIVSAATSLMRSSPRSVSSYPESRSNV
jgi:pimeloyl-ACP methyl ester carboxylesterase